MDELNLSSLSLFITEEMVIIPEELQKISLSQKFKNNDALIPHQKELVQENGNVAEIQIEDILAQVKGQFQKGIVVIHEGHELESSLQEFLLKILGAVNCSLKDIALIGADNIENMPESCIDVLNPNKIIVFGLIHHPIFEHKKSKYIITQPSFEILFADDLKDISENVALKKQLWTSLQSLFQINK
ncbi:hypothetical protein KI659_03935 [Litoribacter alkaliphilus]|uniref:Uncharacterized protein n=1 Tax=Litoribacter ruber TaxID=702568 RepID=A0AAP2G3M2_9BACT|nr:hypothetical protein [Litoribacter alkaliphilus]MBS9523161.1 hypothetical protein [Litoribacter alkaliphilus]